MSSTIPDKPSPAQQIHIDAFHIYPTDELFPRLYYSSTEDFQEEIASSEDAGSILIRLGVDGESDHVLLDAGQSRDITMLSRSIERLQQVRDRLVTLTPDGMPDRQCMMSGNWGRCTARDSHEGDHEFPTEDEHDARQARLAPKVRKAS